jgi:hypothetical protein
MRSISRRTTQHDHNMNPMQLRHSRGDKTPLELFLAGIASFDASTRAMLEQRMVRLG